MSEYLIQGKSLSDIADAIREKAGSADAMTPAEMVEAILGIQAGGVNVVYGTVTVATKTNKVKLFETEDAPDVLYVTYTPDEAEVNTSSNKFWASMTAKTGDEGGAVSYLFAYINGTRFLPSVSNISPEYCEPIRDAHLQYPWNGSTLEFAAGQTLYFTAIYLGKAVG